MIMLLSRFLSTFPPTQMGMPDGLCDNLRNVPWELLLQLNLVIGFRLGLMYISLIINIRWSFTHLHGFQLLVLQSSKKSVLSFVRTEQNQTSDRKVIAAKEFLMLPNLLMLIKQNSLSIPRNVALITFGKLLTVFSKAQRCCLLHLIKQIVC